MEKRYETRSGDLFVRYGIQMGMDPKKRELGPLSSGQGELMPFVDPDRIKQSDRMQAASFAPYE